MRVRLKMDLDFGAPASRRQFLRHTQRKRAGRTPALREPRDPLTKVKLVKGPALDNSGCPIVAV
jgi:hypothetical protein